MYTLQPSIESRRGNPAIHIPRGTRFLQSNKIVHDCRVSWQEALPLVWMTWCPDTGYAGIVLSLGVLETEPTYVDYFPSIFKAHLNSPTSCNHLFIAYHHLSLGLLVVFFFFIFWVYFSCLIEPGHHLTNISQFASSSQPLPVPTPGNHFSTLCFCEVNVFLGLTSN